MVAFRPEPAGGRPVAAVAGGSGAASAAEPASSAAQTPREGFMALAELTPGNWHSLLEGLGLAGMVYNIARHSELREVRGAHLQFVLDAGNSSLFNDDHTRKIRLALENYFGGPLTVEITPGEPARETPAMRQERLSGERQQAAVASLEADPVLQNLINRFDGELDRSSITSAES